MEKDKYLETVEKAKEVVKLDKQLRKSKGLSTNQYQAELMAKRRATARDVGTHPHTKLLDEKKRYQFDLQSFLENVFPEKFYRPWTHDQKKFIREIQERILSGGQYAVALPRSEGKSTIIAGAVLWSVLYGHRKFLVVACADRKPADRFLKGIKSTLVCDRLAELFPEAVHYIKALGGMSQRAAGQTANGKQTHIGWTASQINMPFVEMDENYLELCKGSIIYASGLTCGIRGMLVTLPDGTPVRPDFLFLDDPQTRESAASPQQCKDRETLIKSDLLPLSGIGTEIACLLACTVIEPDDLADKLLNEWQSTRAKALNKFPDAHETLWKEYIEIYHEAQKHGTQKKECNDFYIAHRLEMDKGAVVGNPHRLNKGELSALQNIYNFIAKYGEKSFWSELQNEPRQSISSIFEIKPALICSRVNHIPRYVIPPEAQWLVIMADINHYGINYVATAFKNDMTAFIVDYGRWPESKRENLIEETEEETTTGSQKLATGIHAFVGNIYKKPYVKNGQRFFPNLIMLDANYMTETVHGVVKALQRKRYPVTCDRGRSNKFYRPAKGDKIIGQAGSNYHYQNGNYGTEIVHNADFYRKLVQQSFLLNTGVAGSISLWGETPNLHEEFADEICSEKLVKYSSEQNFYEWNKKPNQHNDKLDCVVGTYAGASFLGAKINGSEKLWRQKKVVKRETRKAKIAMED